MPDITISELSDRLNNLQQYLTTNQIDLAVVNQNSDLFYYTGSIQPLYLIIPSTDQPFILARKALSRISHEVTHIPFEAFLGTKDMAAIFAKYGVSRPVKAAYSLDTMAYATVARFQQVFGEPEITDISWDIRMLRAVKSEAEIAIQRRAGAIVSTVVDVVKRDFRPGMTEIELSALMENYLRLKGHSALIRCRREGVEMSGIGLTSSGVNSLSGTKFDGICGGRGISPAVPYGASREVIPEHTAVLLDFAFNLDGYIVDQTRMMSWGSPPDTVTKAYDAMVEIERAVIEKLRPGEIWQDIYDYSLELADKLGYADTFMGIGAERVRFIGHGVGLELDEPPFLAPKMKDELAPGMVLAVEPKVALEGLGIIGIEDTLAITNDPPEQLTNAPEAFAIL